MSLPPASVLEAFELNDPLIPLSGGRGLCFQVGGKVLKPSDNDNESQFTSEVIHQMLTADLPKEYRLAIPYPTKYDPYSFVYEGWTVWSLLPGHHKPEGFDFIDLLSISRRFHSDIAKISITRPAYMDSLNTRFHESDKIAWDEKALQSVARIDRDVLPVIQPSLDKLNALKRPILDPPKSQLIHGDMTGNILESGLPGIIDMTFYWRPAALAEAIMVADRLIWDKGGKDIVKMYGDDELSLQILVRALLFRCYAFAIDTEQSFIDACLHKVDFAGAAAVVRERLEENGLLERV